MTDAEIEQERSNIEAPPAPLYVDSKADERTAATYRELVRVGVIADVGINPSDWPYEGDGSIVRPFLTVDQARAAQKPGQNIVVAGYAVIGAAFRAANIPEHIKQRCE